MKNDNNKHVIDFDQTSLRGRISKTIKHLRDKGEEGQEMKQSQAKALPLIPVTGGGKHKYFNNKSNDKI